MWLMVSESLCLNSEVFRELTWSPVDDVISWWSLRVRAQVSLWKLGCSEQSGNLTQSRGTQTSTKGRQVPQGVAGEVGLRR